MSDFSPYQTTLAETKANERKRCAAIVRCRADVARGSAARVRKQGTWNTAWPFCKPRYTVMPAYERLAQVHEAMADALDHVEKAISEGWTLKEQHDD